MCILRQWRIYKILIFSLNLLIIISLPVVAQGLKDQNCRIWITAIPTGPVTMQESQVLDVIISSHYDGPARTVKLSAQGLPSFSSGWTNKQVTCGGCVIPDTIAFRPSYCDSGRYNIVFIASTSGPEAVGDTLYYNLIVADSNRTCSINAGQDWSVRVGERLCFSVFAGDPDMACPNSAELLWDYTGYPFAHGATLSGGMTQRTFCWTPAASNEGIYYAYFSVNDGFSQAIDSVAIMVLKKETPCDRPQIIPEPRFTAGTTNMIYYLPACGGCNHEVCYFDSLTGQLEGCHRISYDRTLSPYDTLSVLIENLSDGRIYGYYVQAFFDQHGDSVTFSERTYSRQDASPPDSVLIINARISPGGAVKISWNGATDRVSYVEYYEIYRHEPGEPMTFVDSIPARNDNNNRTVYNYTDSIGTDSYLQEGHEYFYKAIAVDAVGNHGEGVESNKIVPDATAPCMPSLYLHHDFEYIYTRYVRGVECIFWGKANCPGLQKADSIRFQIAKDSTCFFDAQCQTDEMLFDSDWLPYVSDSTEYRGFHPLSSTCGISCVHGHKYYFRAQTKDNTGNISRRFKDGITHYWSTVDSLYFDCYPPSDINNMTVWPRVDTIRNTCNMTIDWDRIDDHVSGLKQYYVYRKLPNGLYAEVGSGTIDTFYIDSLKDVKDRGSICYRIGSEDNVGNVRDWTQTYKNICDRPAIGPRISVECDTAIENICYERDDSTRITWKNYDDTAVTVYQIRRNGITTTQSVSLGKAATIYLPEDGAYVIRVRGILRSGTFTTWSDSLVIVKDSKPPTPVTTLKVWNDTMPEGYIYLKWDESFDISGILKYRIERRISDEVRFNSIDVTEETSYTDKNCNGCQSFTTFQYYVYRIVPIDRLGHAQEDGNNCDSAYCNRAPKIIDHSIRGDTIKIVWLPESSIDPHTSVISIQGPAQSICTTIYAYTFYSFSAKDSGDYISRVKEIALFGSEWRYTAWSKPDTVHYQGEHILNLLTQPLPISCGDTGICKGRICLKWDSLCGIDFDSCRLTRTDDSDTVIFLPKNRTEYVDSGLCEYTNYIYCLYAENTHGDILAEDCDTAAINPAWMYTPEIYLDGRRFLNEDSIDVRWRWVDSAWNRVGNIYGAESCSIEISNNASFHKDYSHIETGWISANDCHPRIGVDGLTKHDGKNLYFRIEAKDKFGHQSPWSNSCFGTPYVMVDKNPPSPVDTIVLSSGATPSSKPNSIDVTIKWAPSIDTGSGLDYYELRRYRGNENTLEALTRIPGNVNDSVDSGVFSYGSGESTYCYGLYPVDKAGNVQTVSPITFMPTIGTPRLDSVVELRHIYGKWDGKADLLYVGVSQDTNNLGKEGWNDFFPGFWFKSVSANFDTVFTKPRDPKDDYFNNLGTFYYHVKAAKGKFESGWSNIIDTCRDSSRAGEEGSSNQAGNFLECYPNPFNPQTIIKFGMAAAGHVTLKLYNIRGELVRTLLDKETAAGSYSIAWDGSDSNGRQVAVGVYIVMIKCETFTTTRKLLLLR